ncbi:MAG: Oxygen sensor histidine kinase NreB [bacterium ADurb.Bin429]|nr:MAG: Oxygen sensor histidine kinase NreB [bacterium ADurb.Bin429]
MELRFRHRAGHTVWVLEIGAGVYDDAGALQYLIGTALDITARKQTETALQESEWQYQALFAHMNEGFMLCEMVYDERGQPEDWIIDQMNPVLREMLGQAAESPVGKRGSAIFGSAEALAPLLPICAHVAETGVPSRFEAELPTLGKHVVASVFSPRIGRFAAVLYDITARKLAEDQVRVYQRELLGLASELSQAEERERRRIASDLHDSIIQNLALLQIMLGGLRAQADPALHATVDDARALLTASIQSARTLTFELSPPVLYELGLIAALEWIGEQMQQRHGLLVAVKAAGHFRLFSDDHRALLFSIVRELLVNIVKHARADQVTIHAEARDGMVAITVTDDGVGFDPAITEDQRSGYGLFSIRERLRHFGGTLTITSRPGAGTRVELLAPLQHTVSVEVE